MNVAALKDFAAIAVDAVAVCDVAMGTTCVVDVALGAVALVFCKYYDDKTEFYRKTRVTQKTFHTI